MRTMRSKAFYLFLAIVSLLRASISRPLNAPLLDRYDYIVVGGGPAGLTVANRISEDPTVTVLVLEAGQSADNSAINEIPVEVGSNIYSSENWGLYTAPQTYLDGSTRFYPLGKALGGGTIINGMLWSRGSQDDYNDWQSLGNPGWGWDDLLPYFKKSETFTPAPNTSTASAFGMDTTFDPQYHGASGPVNVSYSNYVYNQSAIFFQGLSELGVPVTVDPNNGQIAGASYLPLDLDPHNQTRSDACKAYFDPVSNRTNLYISTGQLVTKLLFEPLERCDNEGNSANGSSNGANSSAGSRSQQQIFGMPLPRGVGKSIGNDSTNWKPKYREQRRVIGVQFSPVGSTSLSTIQADREVILAAGAIHVPQILELSGIGRGPLLESFNITPIIHLPGVGYNLQDHLLVVTQYPYTNTSFTYPSQLLNATLNEAAGLEYFANKTGPWTSGPPDGVAFPSLSAISNESYALIESASAQSIEEYLPLGWHPTVLAGFAAQKLLVINALDSKTRAAYELLNNNAGSLVVSTMRPLTRGTCHITSTNPLDAPTIDPRYGSNPIDLEVLAQALLFNRRLIATKAMAILQPQQWLPSADLDIDGLVEYIKKYAGTEYHPSGTAAMMPRNLGGVVSPELLVYGTTNLRIVDSSTFPIIPAAHLQAVVYAVAEKAADMIKAAQNGSSWNETSQCPGNKTASVGNTTFSATSSMSREPSLETTSISWTASSDTLTTPLSIYTTTSASRSSNTHLTETTASQSSNSSTISQRMTSTTTVKLLSHSNTLHSASTVIVATQITTAATKQSHVTQQVPDTTSSVIQSASSETTCTVLKTITMTITLPGSTETRTMAGTSGQT